MEARVHNSDYLKGQGMWLGTPHAYIGIVEVWNEINSSAILEPDKNDCSQHTCYWEGTYDQIRRIAEDVNCAWTGTGTIHVNGFSPLATTKPCPGPVNPQVTIVGSPSAVSDTGNNRSVLCNFLYGDTTTQPGHCEAPPKGPLGTCVNLVQYCPWYTGGSNPSGDMPSPAGANAIGAVLFHPYGPSPERIYWTDAKTIAGFLQNNEKAKPLMASEWGAFDLGQPGGYSADGQIADLARRTMGLLQNGTSLSVEWEYDSATQGTECNPCNQQTGIAVITPLGTANNAVYDWLNGKTFTGCTTSSSPSTTTIKCGLTQLGSSYRAEIAWECTGSTIDACATATDVKTLSCSGNNNNAWCGSTSYSAPIYVTQWRDLAGGLPHTGIPTMIGAKPIIAESGPGTEP
jgi:hypothetical protein